MIAALGPGTLAQARSRGPMIAARGIAGNGRAQEMARLGSRARIKIENFSEQRALSGHIGQGFSDAEVARSQPAGLLRLIHLGERSLRYLTRVCGIVKAWNEISVKWLEAIIDAFLKRLTACIAKKEGHFEHLLT
uniref:Uncharacterized protein n=1 Tax=Ditylenchus dipsaci TaxID=166011 RepID=A0A915EGK4_9BILA